MTTMPVASAVNPQEITDTTALTVGQVMVKHHCTLTGAPFSELCLQKMEEFRRFSWDNMPRKLLDMAGKKAMKLRRQLTWGEVKRLIQEHTTEARSKGEEPWKKDGFYKLEKEKPFAERAVTTFKKIKKKEARGRPGYHKPWKLEASKLHVVEKRVAENAAPSNSTAESYFRSRTPPPEVTVFEDMTPVSFLKLQQVPAQKAEQVEQNILCCASPVGCTSTEIVRWIVARDPRSATRSLVLMPLCPACANSASDAGHELWATEEDAKIILEEFKQRLFKDMLPELPLG